MLRLLLCALVVTVMTTAANASEPFILDFKGWNKEAKPTREQRTIATAYLEAAKRTGWSPKNEEVAQVFCTELPQDLVATHRFFHCRIVYTANAVDGGPLDDGHVMAWDGKSVLLHTPTPRREGDPLSIGTVPGSPPVDLRAGETVRGLAFHDPETWHPMLGPRNDVRGPKLSAALDEALRRRAGSLSGGAAKSPPAWLTFALAVHFDAPAVELSPGLASRAELEKEFGGSHPGYAAAAALSQKTEPGSIGLTVRLRAVGTAVFVLLDPPANGFSFRERTVAQAPRFRG